MSRCKDLTGQRFGKLIIIERAYSKNGHVYWLCQCDCGNTTYVSTSNLTKTYKPIMSCGCAHFKHSLSNHRIKIIWSGMKQRCFNPKSKAYKNYGGRGITVCSEWKDSLINFYNWAVANGYNKDLELDRINNNDNYCPENCRWISHRKQQLNKRTNRLITYRGITKTLKEWTDELGLDYHRTNIRLLKGWDADRAFNEPVHIRGNRKK